MIYERFGVVFSSPCPLDMTPVSGGAAPEVDVVEGGIGPGGDLLWETSPPEEPLRVRQQDGGVVLEWEHARYLVRPGTVVVDADDLPGAVWELLGPPWTVVLADRGIETMHASAVALPQGSVAFMGVSGAGKTSLSWELTRRGFPLVADDLLPLDRGARPVPGLGDLRLRPDVAERHGVDTVPDLYGKHAVTAPVVDEAPPLVLIVAMTERAEAVRRVEGARAVELVRQNFFSPLLTAPGQALRRFELAHHLATTVPIVEAPPRTLRPDDVLRLLEIL